MQRLLIILGLVIIPFYEIILRIFPFAIISAPDSRVTKEEIALVFALSIGLLAVFHGEIKSFRNKFLLLIPVYLLINLIMAPHIPLVINNNEVGDFYFWKPFGEFLCFSMMIIAIASMEINFKEILRVMVWCGVVMSAYLILQRFGLDQFWTAKTGHDFTSVREYTLGGNLGQPTVVSSWIVMMVPLAIYLKKWWMAILMVLACLLTHGVMVALALFVIGISYAIKFNKYFSLLLIPMIIFGSIFIINHKKYVINRMDGRYEVWKNVISDIKNGQLQEGKNKYPITGVGLGRFSFSFPQKHNSQFQQAHNDSMEFIYDCGLIGGFLLFAGLFVMIKNINFNPLSLSVFISFLAVFVCSLGSFPFQLGAHQFYSAVLVGMLNNDSLIKGA